MAERDPLLQALTELESALEQNLARTEQMKRRIAQIQDERRSGRPWREIVESERPPLIVELLRESSQALDDAGARVRRTEALALHGEGMTMEQIAAKFGVSRQRVSGLLRDGRAEPA